MNGFLQDLGYSTRRLISAPAFTVAVMVILGLGIGANSALFTALDRMIIRPLPYAKPAELVMLWEDFSAYGAPKNRVSPATFLDWRKRARTFEEMAAYAGPRVLNISQDGPPEEVLGQSVSPALFPLLGIEPLLGRTFTVEEDRPGSKVIVLSHSLWHRRFHADPKIVGQAVLLSGVKYDVIGIMPAGFQFPNRQSEFWIPLGLNPQLLALRNSHFLYVVGRLREGQTLQGAQENMTAVAGELAAEFPATNSKVGITLVPLKDEFIGETQRTLVLLLCSAGCVLLIACANVSNLLLARSSARTKEIAIRCALGASPVRVLRQVLIENLLLSCAGGAVGLICARWIMMRISVMIPPALAGVVDLSLDSRAVAITAGISIFTSLLFGLAPALKLVMPRTPYALQDFGRGNTGRAGASLRDALVVAETGIALVLVIGAVLMIKTMTHLRSFDAGFKADKILTAQINAPFPKYADSVQRQNFYDRILESVRAIPGVQAVGLTSDLPFTSRGNTMSLKIEGRETQARLGADALFRLVSAGYLETMSARLLEGRFLNSSDRMETVPAVVVNETLARQYWPGESALGKRIDTGTGDGVAKWMTIVGVVRDVRERGLDLDSKAAVYVPFTQTTIGFFHPSQIAVLMSRDPLTISKELQDAVWTVDSEQPVSTIATMESIVEGEFAQRTQVLEFLGAFAALALILATFGIYGVLSYVVSLRTREIGLRMAVGASPSVIVREMLYYSSKRIIAGITLGVLSAFGATRLLTSLLFGVSALDMTTFFAVSAGLAFIALFSSWLPLLRASRVDPVTALRLE